MPLALIAFFSCQNEQEPFDELSKEFEGKINVIISESFDNNAISEISYELVFTDSKTGLMHQLNGSDNEIESFMTKSGSNVTLKGIINKEDNVLNYSSLKLEPQIISDPSIDDSTRKAPGKGKKMLVVMLSDSLTLPACTTQKMENDILGPNNSRSVKNLYENSSRGKFSISEVEFVDLYVDNIECGITFLNLFTKPKLEGLGYSFRSYDFIMYVSNSKCPQYGGQAILNAKYFHNDLCTWDVVTAHELGHAVGMNHAANTVNGYGDKTDVMGIVYKEFNAPHRVENGWLSNKNVLKPRNSGVYGILPLHLDITTAPQVILLDDLYYVSYREAQGAIDIDMSAIAANKVNIHSKASGTGKLSRFLAGIDTGESFTLPDGTTIENLGFVNGKSDIRVTYP